MDESFVDLYWLPVGAGTHFQRWSLLAYEAVVSVVARRERAVLYHAALKVCVEGVESTLELMPVPAGQRREVALMTGPVGCRGADRLRLFRYQLLCVQGKPLPDEEYAVASPLRLTTDCAVARRVLELGPTVPAYTWGRRARGTSEMWTSDSVMSWLLANAGIAAGEIALPPGGRAPGWNAGLSVAGGRHGPASREV
ncbi:hypothetical protein AYO38_10505, partial [bacterium SCGC AG-212-C10]